nr:DUF6617 family protein [uncultured Flavobacterium sp.]
METFNNPLQYLEDILFTDGLNNFMSSFIANEQLISEGYEYYQPDDNYVRFDLIEPSGSKSPELYCEVINRVDYLVNFLNKHKANLYQKLKTVESDPQFSAILYTFYTSLSIYLNKVSINDSKYKDVLNQHLYTIVSDLRIKYPIIEKHKVFRIFNDASGYISYFQYKDLKASFFEDLYEVTYKLDLIDDAEVAEEVFYDVFTLPKPNLELKITFTQKNHLIAFYLKEIEPFFNNFNPVTIEQSKSFFNKQGKPLTSTDLYTSLSRNKGKDLEYLKKIKSNLDELKRTYLK